MARDLALNLSGPAMFSVTVTVSEPVQETKPPMMTTPKELTVEATDSGGATVTFTVTATDRVDGPLPVSCTPRSGSLFPVGVTKVTCSATNTAGVTATRHFPVKVRLKDAPKGRDRD
jgi:hypothetical protein